MLPALVQNIHEATESNHRVYLVMEHDDTASLKAAERLDTVDVVGEFGSCSRAVNAGYWASDEPFAAVVNDDCVFHHGWDTKALAKFSDPVHVVGLNDGMGDPKCFFVARRAFIEQESGVFDRPNTDLPHLQVPRARHGVHVLRHVPRGVGRRTDAIVEHRNWRNGAADPDHPNYLKARDTIVEDLEEYQRRAPLWDPDGRMPAGHRP